MPIRVASPSVRIQPPDSILAGDSAAIDASVRQLQTAIRNTGYALLKLGSLRADADLSFEIAHALLSRFCGLEREDGLVDLQVEVDDLDDTMVSAGLTRDRLPHNDSQRTTYLTPSLLHATRVRSRTSPSRRRHPWVASAVCRDFRV